MSKSLYSVTENPFTGGGIFTALQALNPPWADVNIAAQLDLIYYGNVSGSKLVSPLVERIMTGAKLSAVETATLAGALMATNGDRWNREWVTLSAQYDPIENYRMIEEMTDDETVTEYGRRDTRTDNLAHSETRTDDLEHTETRTDDLQHSETRTDDLEHSETRTDNLAQSETRTDNLQHSETRTDNLSHRKTGTETSTPDVTVTEETYVYGFNSGSASHDGKKTSTSDGTNETTYNITENDTGTVGTQGSNTGTQSTQGTNTGTQDVSGSNTGTQSTVGSNTGTQEVSGTDTGTQSTQGTNTGTQTNAASGSDTSTRNYQLTRSGNIGVTTSQQMLQSERDLWMWSFFYDVVFPDVDTVLTIPIYAEEDESGTPGGIVPTGTIAIIMNGTYDVTNYANASVDVPNSYSEADEGKVVSNGQLVSQTTGVITTNGEHNTLLLSSVDVRVPNTYSASDVGKVVKSVDGVRILTDQTQFVLITTNGEIDTTYISGVQVSVPQPPFLYGVGVPTSDIGNNDDVYVRYFSEQGEPLNIVPYRKVNGVWSAYTHKNTAVHVYTHSTSGSVASIDTQLMYITGGGYTPLSEVSNYLYSNVRQPVSLYDVVTLVYSELSWKVVALVPVSVDDVDYAAGETVAQWSYTVNQDIYIMS